GGLVTELGELVDLDPAVRAKDLEDDRDRDRCLARGEGDDEDGEDLAGRLRLSDEVIEGDEVERGGVEDQLHSEEHPDRVPAGDDGEESQPEEDGADDEVVCERRVNHSGSRRATVNAPIIAATRTSEASSNGIKYSPRSAWPSFAVDGTSARSCTGQTVSIAIVVSAPTRR